MSLNCQSKARGRQESVQACSCGKGLSQTGCRRGMARRILLFSPARVLGFTLMTAYLALPPPGLLQILTRQRMLGAEEFSRCPLEDDPAALIAAFWTHINDPVCVANHI